MVFVLLFNHGAKNLIRLKVVVAHVHGQNLFGLQTGFVIVDKHLLWIICIESIFILLNSRIFLLSHLRVVEVLEVREDWLLIIFNRLHDVFS